MKVTTLGTGWPLPDAARAGASNLVEAGGQRFLVDTGAVYTVLPEAVWRRVGLRAERTIEFGMADGTTIARGVSEARISVGGRTATSPVVLGAANDALLLGAVTLETLGLMLNPLSRELLPMRPMLSGSRA